MAELKNVAGLDELARALRAFTPTLARKHLKAAVAAGTAIVRDAAQRSTAFHDRTGSLRAHIRMKAVKASPLVARYEVFVATRRGASRGIAQHFDPTTGRKSRVTIADSPFYWRFVEFGTAKMTARPFMRPAFQNNRERAADAIIEKLASGVEATAQEVSK